MSWIEPRVDLAPAGQILWKFLAQPRIVRLPGAFNGMTALKACRTSFSAHYFSGASVSAAMGFPDLGILTKQEIMSHLEQIVRASGLPVVVDGDTGYGGVLNVVDVVPSFEQAGAAAVHLEGLSLPENRGHLNDKNLLEPAEMAAKVATAVGARLDMVVIARTDAAASEGLPGAVARARLYVEAHADAMFPEALTSREMFAEFARQIDVPLLANMTELGRTLSISAAEFEQLGFRMVIWPISALRITAEAQERLYAHLIVRDRLDALLSEMQIHDELYELIAYFDHEILDANMSKTMLTDVMRGRTAAEKAN